VSNLLHVALRYETLYEWTREGEKLTTLFGMNMVKILTRPSAIMNKGFLRICRLSRQLRDAAHSNMAKICMKPSSVLKGLD
jgi:hypothetical protein